MILLRPVLGPAHKYKFDFPKLWFAACLIFESGAACGQFTLASGAKPG